MADDEAAIWKRRCLHARAWAAYHHDWECYEADRHSSEESVRAGAMQPTHPPDPEHPPYGLRETEDDGWDGFLAEQEEAVDDGHFG